ncbi:MAG: ComF family protein [Bacillota bacterium]
MTIWKKILDFIYPENNQCLKCGQKYFFSEIDMICDSCLLELKILHNYCRICGRGLEDLELKYCSYCQENEFYFDLARSIGLYGGILKELLINFKYNHHIKTKTPLVNLLFIYLKYYYISENIDNIVPVPIHEERRKTRGYNQAELLASGLSGKSGIPLSSQLIRTGETPPLYNFAFEQRKLLLENSFFVEKGCYQGKNLLLIDDIFTTGATSNEISFILKKVGGAESVFVLTIATALTF